VVFLGDSVTVGTPPTYTRGYRFQIRPLLEAHFGTDLEHASCARWGARADDLLLPPNQQIHECFPRPEPKRTLVLMTVGGNDFAAMAKRAAEGASQQEVLQMVDEVLQVLHDAITWLRADPARFPNGVFVAFANVFEYTDATGDLDSCLFADFAGLGGQWPEGRAPAIRLNEGYMRIAVETGTDIVFMLENFCGHGFHNEDPQSQCYRGPGAERWIDFTCIHPNARGHEELARMFMAVVGE
jgi:lysophospholipase L1-like esterase